MNIFMRIFVSLLNWVPDPVRHRRGHRLLHRHVLHRLEDLPDRLLGAGLRPPPPLPRPSGIATLANISWKDGRGSKDYRESREIQQGVLNTG